MTVGYAKVSRRRRRGRRLRAGGFGAARVRAATLTRRYAAALSRPAGEGGIWWIPTLLRRKGTVDVRRRSSGGLRRAAASLGPRARGGRAVAPQSCRWVERPSPVAWGGPNLAAPCHTMPRSALPCRAAPGHAAPCHASKNQHSVFSQRTGRRAAQLGSPYPATPCLAGPRPAGPRRAKPGRAMPRLDLCRCSANCVMSRPPSLSKFPALPCHARPCPAAPRPA